MEDFVRMKTLPWFAIAMLAMVPFAGCGESKPVQPPAEVKEAETDTNPPTVELGEPEESN